MMRVIEITKPGGPEVLRLAHREIPEIPLNHVLVRVVAAGVNRPDISQRKGFYPPPPGVTDIPGLDIAGIVEQAAPGVAWPKAGDPICALVAGGGYAEYCIVPAIQCMQIPAGLSMLEAAALPEVFFTAWNNIIWGAQLQAEEILLVQGGTSGVGLAAIQLAKQVVGATVIATSGTEEKQAVCRKYGADYAISYRGDWEKDVQQITGGEGVNVILDSQAGSYVQRELNLLAIDGRLVLIGSHLGTSAEINTRQIIHRRLKLMGTTVRSRSAEYKQKIAQGLMQSVWHLLQARKVVMPICACFKLEDAIKAHEMLDANLQIGKVVLEVT
ncbi:NAD(P)H-quinone oxidoreductase [Ferrovibrio sp.]|uniref:NAD(P)H-quinone oxidoreductase n=1 Tax=Ferrovibrio sp. TaxID=1917215 RepID=UPI0025BCA66D|nr:NAD(P)H-quinone oxidoreductase [Ferrovibrio sp.]MBX3456585.1 NAD(P)H-quinone oxidoreductase [Ferrovibrio sp.]